MRVARQCQECGGRLVPIGTARKNGVQHHGDWSERPYHKKCFIARLKRKDRLCDSDSSNSSDNIPSDADSEDEWDYDEELCATNEEYCAVVVSGIMARIKLAIQLGDLQRQRETLQRSIAQLELKAERRRTSP
jgi:hypothetical protein